MEDPASRMGEAAEKVEEPAVEQKNSLQDPKPRPPVDWKLRCRT